MLSNSVGRLVDEKQATAARKKSAAGEDCHDNEANVAKIAMKSGRNSVYLIDNVVRSFANGSIL